MIKLLYYLFIRDWPLKLFSLALAVLTWLAISFSIRKDVVNIAGAPSTAERTFFDVPVDILSKDSNIAGVKTQPAELDVTVQGEPRLLEDLKAQQIHVFVDLSSTQLTTNLQRKIQIVTPSGVTYTHAQPDVVDVIVPAPAPAKEKPQTNSP